MNLPIRKIDRGSVILAGIVFAFLYTGWPFDNPMPFKDIWRGVLMLILSVTVLMAMAKSIVMIFEKWY